MIQLKSLLGLCVLLTLCGCASIVSDNKSVTYLETTPEACKCELHGQDFTRVVTTPDSISLPSEAAPLTIACTAPGYKRTTATLDTAADGWIWGNIIFGGIVGGVVDAARGAGFKYPAKFSLMLEPESFPTVQDRDAWYDKRKAGIEAAYDLKLKRLKSQCPKKSESNGLDSDDTCKRGIAAEEKARDLELELNEKARGEAKVAPVVQASTPEQGA